MEPIPSFRAFPHNYIDFMSRHDAHETLRLDDYRAAMEGIYSTSVSERTIDEARRYFTSDADRMCYPASLECRTGRSTPPIVRSKIYPLPAAPYSQSR